MHPGGYVRPELGTVGPAQRERLVVQRRLPEHPRQSGTTPGPIPQPQIDQLGATRASTGPGDILERAGGNRELAIQNYQRSIELDPTNRNAIDVVKRLSGGAEAIDSKVFADYKGRYESPLGIITVTLDQGKLFAQPEGRPKEELVAKSSTSFRVTNVEAEVEFVRDDQGQVARMLVRISGEQMEAKRIK